MPVIMTHIIYQTSNKTYTVKSHTLHKLKIKSFRMFPLLGRIKGMQRIYESINTSNRKIALTKKDIETLRYLDDEYKPYNQELAKKWGIDLSSWERLMQ